METKWVYPSKLEEQTVADWLRKLLKENLVGACVDVDGVHLHVDLKVVGRDVEDAA